VQLLRKTKEDEEKAAEEHSLQIVKIITKSLFYFHVHRRAPCSGVLWIQIRICNETNADPQHCFKNINVNRQFIVIQISSILYSDSGRPKGKNVPKKRRNMRNSKF